MNTSRLNEQDRALAEWLEAVCAHVEKDGKKGNYALLHNLGPAVVHFYENVYSKRGARLSFNYWRGVYVPYYCDVQEMHQAYTVNVANKHAAARRELAQFHEALAGLSSMTLDEIEGLIKFIQKRIDNQQRLQHQVGEMSAEDMVAVILQLQDELKARRLDFKKAKEEAEANAKKAQQESTARKLRAGIMALAEDVRGE